ncbi:hypothetical protein RHGRI_030411 [Rhododendron griersonianum]|uniref:Response regulatory domain-containing protein n=1 Tax=Rhododendron griersonianum TaxID=479676 RepID=A0AAV6IMU7_9ERIC|nr:hypothetical protein RHGRI_030411 [Rhododendron griersonianum]
MATMCFMHDQLESIWRALFYRTKAIRKLEMERGSHIPIVALTARAMSSDEAKCLEEGMDAYLTKPWCPPSFR